MIGLTALSIYTFLFLVLTITTWKRDLLYPDVAKIKSDTISDEELPSVSLVVPMRNEERNARKCIESLVVQDYPDFEVVVVDDKSTDGTSEILRELSTQHNNLIVVAGRERPDGWSGKNWAVHQGFGVSRGDIMLIMDADTKALSPHMLGYTVRHMIQNGLDMLSLTPLLELFTFWEKQIVPLFFVQIISFYPNDVINKPKAKSANAIGQFLMIKSDVYRAIGGHEKIKDKHIDDYHIAQLVKQNGYKGAMADGKKVVSVRMYDGLKEIWFGCMRLYASTIKANLIISPLVLLSDLMMGFLPLTIIAASSVYLFSEGYDAVTFLFLAEGVSLYVLRVLALWKFYKYLEMPFPRTLTVPLGTLILLIIFLIAGFKVLSGGSVPWKGRSYTEV